MIKIPVASQDWKIKKIPSIILATFNSKTTGNHSSSSFVTTHCPFVCHSIY